MDSEILKTVITSVYDAEIEECKNGYIIRMTSPTCTLVANDLIEAMEDIVNLKAEYRSDQMFKEYLKRK